MQPIAVITLLVLLTALPAQGFQESPTDSGRYGGTTFGIGYGAHRSFNRLMSATNNGESRSFDGSYLQLNGGYLTRWGGVLGLDWTYYSGTNKIGTSDSLSQLSLDKVGHAFSVLAGMELGTRVRFQLATVSGIALERAERRLTVQNNEDLHNSSRVWMTLGLQGGFDVFATRWLAIGGRARVLWTIGGEQGGVLLGLSAQAVL